METTATAEPTGPDREEIRAAASAAVAPDAVTAALLAKHSAGEKLTPTEYGKLGAFKKWLKNFGRKEGPGPGPAQPGPAPGHAPGVAPVAPAQASDGGLPPVPIDAGLVQRTTGAILTRLESIARRYVGNAAREAGATGEILARCDRAAALPKDDRALMVDLSPEVFTSLGIDPRHYPVAVFFGVLGLWSTDLWLVVQDLRAMKEKKPEVSKPEPTILPIAAAGGK